MDDILDCIEAGCDLLDDIDIITWDEQFMVLYDCLGGIRATHQTQARIQT